ncbi:SPOR domain-containing protein [Kangiella sp.]|uniref:SPOR domain-containing protein n=1 Tax=Kangiella sp. TaxID=1920245 RepID=UPI00199D0484|nr:SPOR domain-containing protein [Kangiella sp.]MBD3653773.1 SPOR domain-containing protein [Kangiella sp.]
MSLQLTKNSNPFAAEKRVLFLPESWKRLISVVRHKAINGGYTLIEGEFGAGKSTFGLILEKRLLLDESVDCLRVQVHPLSTFDQLINQLPKQRTKPLIVVVDDAHEASTSLLVHLTEEIDNVFWLLLGEAGTSERVSDFYNNHVILPLFSKQDCYQFLLKQLHDQPKMMQLSQMQSDTIWYASKGLPKLIVEQAEKNMQKLISGYESNESFEKANKGWWTTAILTSAFVVFIIVLIVSDSEEPQTNHLQNQKLEVVEDQGGDKIGQAEAGNDTEQSIQQEPDQSDESHIDPIAEIALSEPEPTAEELVVASKPRFKEWFEAQSRDHYSIQLFSNTNQQAANEFQKSLDLADSFVYKAKVNDETRYRVLWGSYRTRAEAEQAVLSLPAHILNQQPWIRPFSAIASEISQ